MSTIVRVFTAQLSDVLGLAVRRTARVPHRFELIAMPQSVALLFCGHESVDASVNSGSLDARPDGAAVKQVIAALRSTEFRLLPWQLWRDFRRCAAATHAAVIVAARLDIDGSPAGLHEKEFADFPCPLILVTNSERENLRHLGKMRVDHVVYGDEVNSVAQLLTSVALSDGRLLLRATINRRDMHPTLRTAMIKLVDQLLPAPTQNHRACRRFPRTVEDLATLADVTADYLRHLATEARLPIGRVLRRYAALQALEMLAAGFRAHVVAECFGYEDMSGLGKLIRRNLGARVRSLVQTGLQPHYAEIARLVETKRLRNSP